MPAQQQALPLAVTLTDTFQFMTLLKRFWNDFTNLSRFQFGCKYVFPIVALFMTWGVLANLYQTHLDKHQLLQNKGEVNNIAVVFEQGTKSSYKYYPLKISLAGFPNDFRLRDNFKDWFQELQDEIKPGDTIEIYTRNKFQSTIGWGQQNDIYQIEKNNKILLPMTVIGDYNRSQSIVILVMAILFWIPFILYKLKIIQPK